MKMSNSKESGLFFLLGSTLIKVKEKKITAKNIRPPPTIVQAFEREGKLVEVQNATKPIFREDAVSSVLELMQTQGFGAEDIFGKAKTKMATTKDNDRFQTFVTAIAIGLSQIPMQTYTKILVEAGTATEVNKDIVQKYLAKDVDGVIKLELFPRLEKTHKLTIDDQTVQPRIFWDEMLQAGDSLYELYVEKDDVLGRKALADLAAKMNAWTYTDKTHSRLGQTEEVMAVVEGVVLMGGSTQEYIALIAPKRILAEGGEEKFVYVMKLCQSNVEYAHAMAAPREEELKPQFKAQKPLVMASFAEMLAKSRAK